MPDDAPRKRLTIADLRPIARIGTLAQPPRAAPRPPVRPARPSAPPSPVPPPPAPPPPAPSGKTEAHRAKDRRHRAKWRAKHELPQAEVLAVLSALGARYPAVFGASCVPLAIGIHHAILAQTGIDPAMLKPALRRWCYRDAYLAGIVEGSHRHGLDGTPVTELTDEERAAAAVQLKAMQAAMKRRKP